MRINQIVTVTVCLYKLMGPPNFERVGMKQNTGGLCRKLRVANGASKFKTRLTLYINKNCMILALNPCKPSISMDVEKQE